LIVTFSSFKTGTEFFIIKENRANIKIGEKVLKRINLN